MPRTLIGIQADANKPAGQIDEVFLREQTVLRGSVAWSEHPRYAAALGGCSNEHDGPIASLGFSFGCFPGGVPGDARFPQIQGRGSQITGARTSRVDRARSDDQATNPNQLSQKTHKWIKRRVHLPGQPQVCKGRAPTRSLFCQDRHPTHRLKDSVRSVGAFRVGRVLHGSHGLLP